MVGERYVAFLHAVPAHGMIADVIRVRIPLHLACISCTTKFLVSDLKPEALECGEDRWIASASFYYRTTLYADLQLADVPNCIARSYYGSFDFLLLG
jgi:hypothetical protein